jgi:hypothetical protein
VVPNTLRGRIDQASLPLMTKLTQLPRAVPFLVLLVLLVGGVFLQNAVGFVLMGLATLFVGWILYLSWPRLNGTERMMRSAVLLLAVAMVIVHGV